MMRQPFAATRGVKPPPTAFFPAIHRPLSGMGLDMAKLRAGGDSADLGIPTAARPDRPFARRRNAPPRGSAGRTLGRPKWGYGSGAPVLRGHPAASVEARDSANIRNADDLGFGLAVAQGANHVAGLWIPTRLYKKARPAFADRAVGGVTSGNNLGSRRHRIVSASRAVLKKTTPSTLKRGSRPGARRTARPLTRATTSRSSCASRSRSNSTGPTRSSRACRDGPPFPVDRAALADLGHGSRSFAFALAFSEKNVGKSSTACSPVSSGMSLADPMRPLSRAAASRKRRGTFVEPRHDRLAALRGQARYRCQLGAMPEHPPP